MRIEARDECSTKSNSNRKSKTFWGEERPKQQQQQIYLDTTSRLIEADGRVRVYRTRDFLCQIQEGRRAMNPHGPIPYREMVLIQPRADAQQSGECCARVSPIAHLPIANCLLPIAYCVLHIANRLLPLF